MPVARMTKSDAIDKLRAHLAPGDTLYTVLRHASASGMTRAIDVYTLRCAPDGSTDKSWLSYWASAALRWPFNDRYESVNVSGAGMDMGFHLVYALSSVLFPDGFDCAGDRCRSNDHSNGDRDHGPHRHEDGGYALRHEWI